jgi:hypothetical protein
LSLYNGRIGYIRSRGPMVSKRVSMTPAPSGFAFLGLTVTRGYWGMVPDSDRTAYRCDIAIPLYWLLLLAVPLPALHLLFRLWRADAGRHLCPRCGYDLRGTPERCPECGLTRGVR